MASKFIEMPFDASSTLERQEFHMWYIVQSRTQSCANISYEHQKHNYS